MQKTLIFTPYPWPQRQNLLRNKFESLRYYSKSYDFVPLPLQRYRDSPSATVTERYRPLLTITESYRYLRYKRYQRYIIFLNKTLNICSKHTILRSVTLVTQVTVKFGNGQ